MTLLWLYFESWRLFKATGGSPDVVHLIKYAWKVFRQLFKFNTVLKANEQFLWNCRNFRVFFLFEGGRYVWPHVSKPFLDKPKTFLASFDRKFPELFKIHPIFIHFALLRALKSIELKILLYSMTLCSSFNWAPSSLRSIFYQMDHTCWAHSRLKKFPGLKIKSQWSFSLYRSLNTTLYIGHGQLMDFVTY